MGKDIEHRAEVPDTLEMRIMLTPGTEKGWSIGSLDVKSAFLPADLNEGDDGPIVVQPPTILLRMGLAK